MSTEDHRPTPSSSDGRSPPTTWSSCADASNWRASPWTTGTSPFGSVLVDQDGQVLFEDRNRVKDGDQTRHPELAIARWAADYLTPEERAREVVYTSGEHCPMCAAAHAWVGLGEIVIAASTQQLDQWLREWGIAPGPVAPLPISTVAPGNPVRGPVPELSDETRQLHARRFLRAA